jgi:hypothetical protein
VYSSSISNLTDAGCVETATKLAGGTKVTRLLYEAWLFGSPSVFFAVVLFFVTRKFVLCSPHIISIHRFKKFVQFLFCLRFGIVLLCFLTLLCSNFICIYSRQRIPATEEEMEHLKRESLSRSKKKNMSRSQRRMSRRKSSARSFNSLSSVGIGANGADKDVFVVKVDDPRANK